MSVALSNNALFASGDIALLLDRLGLAADTPTDTIYTIINQVSDSIEAYLKVNNGGIEYKAAVKQQTFTDITFTGSGQQSCYAPVYPLISVSSLKYTEDWVTYTKEYATPYVKLDDYSIYLPNDVFRNTPAGTRATIVCGYATIPQAILKVAEEMIKIQLREGSYQYVTGSGDTADMSTIGGNKLGVKSEGVSSQATTSTTYNILDISKRHAEILDKFKRPEYAIIGKITR